MLRKFITFSLILPLYILCFALGAVVAQPPSGQTETGRKTITKPTPKDQKKSNQTKSTSSKSEPAKRAQTSRPTETREPAECADSEILVRCDLPECNVLLDGKSQGITSLNGELQFPAANGKRNIVVSRNGYETGQTTATVSCGELKTVSVKLKAKPFEVKLKTNLPNCDVLINDPPELIGKTNDYGAFSFTARSETVYIQAKKQGYLSDSKSVSALSAQKEVLLSLKPMPARVFISANARKAFAQADGDEKLFETSEPFSVEPGRRKVVVTALGFKPLALELDLQPNQRIEKTVSLERLPVAEMLVQAEQFFREKSFDKTIQLSRYVIETEPNNGAANRLIGTIYLEKQNYAEAEPFLLKALNGDETIVLNIRRHLGEKFELSAGHGAACEGQLRIGKNEIEYRGGASAAENFKVPYGGFQVLGLQVKKNTALSLSLKVSNEKGSKKEYNFFSRERELSQDGKLYLALIQRLLQRAGF